MIVHIGRFNFINKEALESLLASKLVKKYDFSPEAREKHDEEARFTEDKKQIKATILELRSYWTEQLKYTNKENSSIKLKETVANPWIK
jgi:flagellar biosynthesis/type III secretory pathway chaperone